MPCLSPRVPLALLPYLALLAGCSGGGDILDNGSSGIVTAGNGTGASETDDASVADDTASTTASTCDEDVCEGTCVDDTCCEPEQVCNDQCCGDGQVCSFQQCVVPGEECVDATECPDGDYCEYSLGEPGEPGDGNGMCQGGVVLATGRCLPEPPECPAGVEPGDGENVECLPQCEVIPPTSFEPTLKYHWDQSDSMMAPIIVQLDDDNCDQVINEEDIPEILFTTFEEGAYTSSGTLHAISIIDGAMVDKWAITPVVNDIHPGTSLAGGDIDGIPGNEIITCTTGGQAVALGPDGTERWTSEYTSGCFMPSIADFDQDGTPEILLRAGILDGATGATKASWAVLPSTVAADVNGDGSLEVVSAQLVMEPDGTVIADVGLAGTYPAIADFDGDGNAEIAAIDNATHSMFLWRLDPAAPGGFELIRSGVNINGALGACPGDSGGGSPTVADFNGDGTPDVGVAAGTGYAVFDGAALMDPAVANPDTLLWISPARDCSSRSTGSSVFDFDGNGSAEVVYGDEQYMRIYDGTTGEILLEECNTTGTLYEYPLIADVDNDGHADIVAISNDYHGIHCPTDDSQQSGLRIFSDQQWVRTRRVWNQHAYHVTNVEEDGSIPAVERPNWSTEGLNNFRQNVQPQGEFSAPDLVASVRGICSPSEFGAIARVRNLGRAAVPAGVPIGFYEGDPAAGGTRLGTGMTTTVLYPAAAQDVELPLPDASEALRTGDSEVWVVIDDGMPEHPWQECRTGNNSVNGPINCNIAG